MNTGGKKKSTFIINKQKLCSSSLYPQLHTWLSLIRPWSQEQTASVSTVTIVFKVKITFPVWALMEQGMATQVAQTSPWQPLGPSNTRSQTWLRFSDLPGRSWELLKTCLTLFELSEKAGFMCKKKKKKDLITGGKGAIKLTCISKFQQRQTQWS